MAAESYAVTVAGAGTKAGTAGGVADWDNAMDMAAWLADMINNAEPGDIYYIEDGTYTLTGAFQTVLNGSAALPVKLIGVKTGTTNEPPVLSDWSLADADRPVIATGANGWRFNDYYQFYNMSKTGTTEWRSDIYPLWQNCKTLNSNGGASNGIYNQQGSGHVDDCNIQSTNGTAILIVGGLVSIIDTYIHDSSVKGIDLGGVPGLFVLHTTIDNCGIGIDIDTQSCTLISNTIYGCTTGINDSGNFVGMFIKNNSITSCTTGASWTSNVLNNFWDYNNWHGNTADTVNVTKGLNATANAPEYTAAGSDFSISGSGNMHGTGFGIRVGVGATPSLISQGAYEPTVVGGAGGLLQANKRGNKQ